MPSGATGPSTVCTAGARSDFSGGLQDPRCRAVQADTADPARNCRRLRLRASVNGTESMALPVSS